MVSLNNNYFDVYNKFLIDFNSTYMQSVNNNKLLENELAYFINTQCFKVCINTQIVFKECIENCEIKHLSSKFIQDGFKS